MPRRCAPRNVSKVIPEGNPLLCHYGHSEAIFSRFRSNDREAAAVLPSAMIPMIGL
ncbi:hypothetical protein [Syntrophomonas palmitatica]|uniref:hypothetical protein n=1 Tax=Syntrophomonas palmitatica TaxID=402877 RepID=UPI000AC76648|nr:hypothetical protein [Syntrophomonas palmitatica]